MNLSFDLPWSRLPGKQEGVGLIQAEVWDFAPNEIREKYSRTLIISTSIISNLYYFISPKSFGGYGDNTKISFFFLFHLSKDIVEA
jgi:hypothetical protein